MGMMSGYWGYRQLGRFVERHRRELIKRLQIPKARVPSYSVIRRVMVNLNYEELQLVFNQWSKESSLIPSSEWISLDGKGLKNTVTNYDNAKQNFINCVSASGNDYLVKVKTNQPKLYQQIEAESSQQIATQTVEDHEKTRNRNSYRKVEVFEPPKNLDSLWIGVGSVIKIERSGTRGNEPYQSISYYLCSLSPQSRHLADGIRGHWLIENALHWVKDVIYEEDISPQKAGWAPRNLSLLKTWVLTLLRTHGFDSIKGAISEMSHNLGYILTFCA